MAVMPDHLAPKTAPTPNADVKPRLLRCYADAAGETHLEVLEISPDAGMLPLEGLTARSYNPTNVGWHKAPQRQFAINLSGDLQVEVTDGTKRKVGPGDLVLLDDIVGKGHITRLLGAVTCLFIRVPDGVDVAAWARGELAKG